jgi:hypothetical protein
MNGLLSQADMHMKKQTHIYCCTILAAFPLLSGSLLAQTLELSDTGTKLDGIVALVNDGVVLESELEIQTAMIVQRLRA